MLPSMMLPWEPGFHRQRTDQRKEKNIRTTVHQNEKTKADEEYVREKMCVYLRVSERVREKDKKRERERERKRERERERVRIVT